MPPLKGFLLFLISVISLMLCSAVLRAEDKNKVLLLSLEWPPYSGAKLAGNGVVSKRVTAAYKAQGQNAKIGFFPWRQTIRLPYTDHRFTGYFPTYPSVERKQVCHLSEPVGVSQVGLAESRKKPLSWKRVEDLARYRIGVVEAYANEDVFDRLVNAGKIQTTSSESDAANLLRLLKGQVDTVVVDANVFTWLLANDARLRPYRDRLQMNERLLVTWPLYVCFRKDEEGAALRDRFNAGLATLPIEGLAVPSQSIKPVKPAPAKSPKKPR